MPRVSEFPKDVNRKTNGKAMVKKGTGSGGRLVIIRAEEKRAASKSADRRLRKD